MSRPKSHHFVPRSYLSRFTDRNGFLHVYEVSSKSFRRQRPTAVMKINAYYRQEWAPAGIDPNVFEKGLGEWLETEAKQSIDNLISAPSTLTDQELAEFFVYLEVQRVRVPRQAKSAIELMRNTILRLAPEEIAEGVDSGKLQLTLKKSARFDYMRWSIGTFTPWFQAMDWEIVSAAEGASFITTDSPVSFYNPAALPPAEAGIGLAGTKVFFPLSSKMLLLMRHPSYTRGEDSPTRILDQPPSDDGHLRIDFGATWPQSVVDGLNWKLLKLAEDIVVGNSPDVLERCISHVNGRGDR